MAENSQLRSLVAELTESNRVLLAEQAQVIEALRAEVAELRARLAQSPRNSHKPPSSEGYEKPAPKSRRVQTLGVQLSAKSRTIPTGNFTGPS